MENNEVPEKFQNVITDFVEDLSTTFPEFAEQLAPYKKDTFKSKCLIVLLYFSLAINS